MACPYMKRQLMAYIPELHHRRTIRLKNYDYKQNGAYFVTVCIRNKECVLGDIINGKMVLSETGKIVSEYWLEIPKHFHNVKLDEFCVMPNHIHGIVVINNNVGTCHGMSLHKENKFSEPIAGSLSVIINQYKSSVKRWCNKNNYHHFFWQSRFYEHIIRNENELNEIREYINNNPLKWELDNENPENITK